MKLVVFRLENRMENRRDESRKEDQLFGNGIKTQFITAFKQTDQFVIGDNAGPRKVLWSRSITRSGQISRTAKRRFGSLGDAKFLLGGAITSYDLSEESKAAGIEADLFFRESQAKAIKVPVQTAKKAFTDRPTTAQDRVAVELWLFDAKTGQRIATTTIEGSPNDSGQAIGGLFGNLLATPAPEMQTPMQRALRGCAIKAVNWVAEQGLAFRAQPPPAPPRPPAKPKPKPEPAGPPAVGEGQVDFGFESEESRPPPSTPVREEEWGAAPQAASPQQKSTPEEWGHEQ